ncbi:MAG TPA: UDP-N-acetylmuramoyl-L-alanine--D-glutamate ligase [Tissierellaceae bacterium]|nr:UDP-N-acetylmuramoyl-L-alanine--D-glutamate ligase [Tissierellaceae bacterium]
MDLENKEVLVIGMGISGLATIKALNNIGAKISITDSKTEEELDDVLQSIDHIKYNKYLGTNNVPLDNTDLIIKSPGIPPGMELIKKAYKSNIPVITDIELGFILSPTDNIIAITGTNGKTTATTLLGEIFNKTELKTFVVGNIGVGILQEINKGKKDDVFIIEASSFQLDDTNLFKPKISLILNISPDHLDWHGDYDNYINAKKKIFKNQNDNDYTVLNYDDKILKSFENEINSKIIWFSLEEKLKEGIYLDEDYIIINDGSNKVKLMSISEIKVPGKHNMENILGSIGVAYAMGVDLEIIKSSIKAFQGIEHRLEFVEEKNGISFYNDSKGTNIEASIKAIEAINTPITLIAGGYDKKIEFDDLIRNFNNVKVLILLGETKEKIKNAAIRNNFERYYLVKDMKEAVELAYKLSHKGDSILLSPSCASWGMYNSFEERGNHFKKLVSNLEEE